MWIALLGGTAGKFSRLITCPGASALGGAITLGATGVLAIAGALDPLGACAFIGTSGWFFIGTSRWFLDTPGADRCTALCAHTIGSSGGQC